MSRTLPRALALLLLGCGNSTTPAATLDAAPYSACTGADLGSSLGTSPGTPCNDNTACRRLGFSLSGADNDRVGLCTRTCRVPSDCPAWQGATVSCDYPVNRPNVLHSCVVLCRGDGGVCPEGSSCVYGDCWPTGL